jgi:hypothetical protein
MRAGRRDLAWCSARRVGRFRRSRTFESDLQGGKTGGLDRIHIKDVHTGAFLHPYTHPIPPISLVLQSDAGSGSRPPSIDLASFWQLWGVWQRCFCLGIKSRQYDG